MNNLLKLAHHLPAREPEPILSVSPVRLESSTRPHPLELRVTAPIEGSNLPVILFSHGDGPSLYLPSKDGYAHLVDFYASQGFVVIQPTHANSKIAGYSHDMPGAPLFWRTRVEEMKLILDRLDDVQASVPGLWGRIDPQCIAAVGHSMGGQTVAMLLGAGLTDIQRLEDTNVRTLEPRIKAGVLLAAPGKGGDSLSDFARSHFTELNPDYTKLEIQALAVVGDADINPFMTVRGADWYEDVFNEAPSVEHQLTLKGAQHSLGGISGLDAKETGDDEKPDTLATVQRMTAAYLRSALYPGDELWNDALLALREKASALASVKSKLEVRV